jgi:hypothetical protein
VPPVVLLVASFVYFAFSAIAAGRRLMPSYHDEYMYQLQAQLLAHGRLWLPAHPLAEFFDAFFVITRPVYASAYFPGTAMLYVPGVWLHVEAWYTSVLIAGGIVALTYVVVAELIDPPAGWVAALLAVSVAQLRVLAVMSMSHTALLLLFLGTAWAYLRWRRGRRIGWAVAMGALAGWCAITRPPDAACLIFPLGLAMLWDLCGTPARAAARVLGVVIVAALPFLLLQLVFDRGVTGHWFRPPITQYGLDNFPGVSGPRSADLATAESPSRLPQVRDYYRDFLRPVLQDPMPGGFLHTWVAGRLVPMADNAVPYRVLFLLIPVGLLALMRGGGAGVRSVGGVPQGEPAARAEPRPPLSKSGPRVALAAGAVLMPLAYTFWPFFLNHYALAVVPAFILLTLLGARGLRMRWPATAAPVTVALVVLAVAALPEVRGRRDPRLDAPLLDDIDNRLADVERKPAVVLFRYHSPPAGSGATPFHLEPVYNIDTARIDAAPVVRAHDLGPAENHRIFDYYAKTDPRRSFYLYDRSTAELKYLGRAGDLAARPPEAQR